MSKQRNINVRVSENEHVALTKLAKYYGLSLSDYVRKRLYDGKVPYQDRVDAVRNILEGSAAANEQPVIGDPEGVSVHDPEVIRAALPRHPGMVRTDFKQGKRK